VIEDGEKMERPGKNPILNKYVLVDPKKLKYREVGKEEITGPTVKENTMYEVQKEGRVVMMSPRDLRKLVSESVKIVLREVEEDDLKGQDLYNYVDSLNLNGGPDKKRSFKGWKQPKDEYLADPLDADTVGEYNFAATTKDMDNKTLGNMAQDSHPQVSNDYGAKQALAYDYNTPEGRAWLEKWNRLKRSRLKV
jgi:hypothetical protein